MIDIDIVHEFNEEFLKSGNMENSFNAIIRYALDGGKFIRAKLVLTNFTNQGDISKNCVVKVALAIEYIHAASLVLDDIMDKDTIRRGKESVYKKFGYTSAQLVSFLMVSLAMELIFQSLKELMLLPNVNKDIYCIVGDNLSSLLKNITIGQYMDTKELNNDPNTFADTVGDTVLYHLKKSHIDVVELIHKKTSVLFEYCFVLPWIYTNYTLSSEDLICGISRYTLRAKIFGLMYQIADDFEDIEQDSARKGKNMVMNYVLNFGHSKAFEDFNLFEKEFSQIGDPPLYKELINKLTSKIELSRMRLLEK